MFVPLDTYIALLLISVPVGVGEVVAWKLLLKITLTTTILHMQFLQQEVVFINKITKVFIT